MKIRSSSNAIRRWMAGTRPNRRSCLRGVGIGRCPIIRSIRILFDVMVFASGSLLPVRVTRREGLARISHRFSLQNQAGRLLEEQLARHRHPRNRTRPMDCLRDDGSTRGGRGRGVARPGPPSLAARTRRSYLYRKSQFSVVAGPRNQLSPYLQLDTGFLILAYK